MKRRSIIVIISVVAVAVIVALAINTHLRLSALEPEGHGDESAEEVLQEVITGEPAHSEDNEEKLKNTENIKASEPE